MCGEIGNFRKVFPGMERLNNLEMYFPVCVEKLNNTEKHFPECGDIGKNHVKSVKRER